jgi:hypothetical protein
MLPLQQLLHRFLHDIGSTSPFALLLCVFVAIAALRRHRKAPPAAGHGWKSILAEARDAVFIILSIWVVQLAVHFTVGDARAIGGIRLHEVLDFGHLAVVLNWTMNCLLRLLPHD